MTDVKDRKRSTAAPSVSGLSAGAYKGALTVLVVITLFTVGFLAYVNFAIPKDDPPQWMLFLGRFHPAVVHMPIGFIFGAFLLEIAGAFARSATLRRAGGVLLFFAAASACLAVKVGVCLEHEGSYDHDMIELHEKLGFATAGLAILACFIKVTAWKKDSKGLLTLYWFLLLGLVGVVKLAGHQGGVITHGANYTFEHMPESIFEQVDQLPPALKDLLHVPAAPGAAVADAEPMNGHSIIRGHCANCHGDGKTKGGLSLETLAEAQAGGKSDGPGITPGNVLASSIMDRITLPHDDPDIMPPEGRTPLSAEEIVAVARWIHAGAPYPTKEAATDEGDQGGEGPNDAAGEGGVAPEGGDAPEGGAEGAPEGGAEGDPEGEDKPAENGAPEGDGDEKPDEGGDAKVGEGEGGEGAAEPVEWDVVLKSIGDQKIRIIMTVRDSNGISLADAKELIEGAPTTIKAGIGKDEAEALKADLENWGAEVELQPAE